jgi:hypothetical protein
MKRIVIGGYRNFNDYEIFKDFVDLCIRDKTEITILSGHCKGTDLMAERYAKEKGFALEIHPADWKKYGKAAGPIRNRQMVENADTVIAFASETATGTKNLIQNAKKLDKELFVKDVGECL